MCVLIRCPRVVVLLRGEELQVIVAVVLFLCSAVHASNLSTKLSLNKLLHPASRIGRLLVHLPRSVEVRDRIVLKVLDPLALHIANFYLSHNYLFSYFVSFYHEARLRSVLRFCHEVRLRCVMKPVLRCVRRRIATATLIPSIRPCPSTPCLSSTCRRQSRS